MAARPSSPAASGTSSSNHAITSLIETINIFVEENDEEENIDLWDSFREEFANYTEQDLHATGRHTLTKLRRFLRTHGVFVERGSHIKIAKALRNLIDVDEYPRWTMNEVTATEGEGPIKSTLLQDYLNRGTTERKRTPEARSSRAASPAADAQPAVRASPRQLPFEPPQPQPGPQLLAQPQQTQHDHRSPNPQAQFLTPQYNPQAQLARNTQYQTQDARFQDQDAQLHAQYRPGTQFTATARLYNVLRKANQQDVSQSVIERITDFCHHCQKHGKSPGRFKFTLREDLNFNSSIIIDMMYIDNNPVLHIVDEATRFQAARWLKTITSSHVWDCLRSCWIDTYIGPPDVIVHDAGKTFISKEFRQNAAALSSIVKEVPRSEEHTSELQSPYDLV